jgi:hypothetical protein
MRLVSKKTFRQWAKALTERGLTVNDAEVSAEIGNAIYVKGTKQTIDPVSSVTVKIGVVSFPIGAVWINGSTYTFPSIPPGTVVNLQFGIGSESDWLVYCYVPYIAITDGKPSIPVDESSDEILNWQVVRVDLAGDIGLEIIQQSDVTPEYENTASTVDSETGVASLGWTRKLLVQITKNPNTGEWYAAVNQDPSSLIIFNADSWVVDNKIDLVGSASLI